ncbi:MAG TPA: maleylpyruvate isomerase N-terminal domain-containing protein, partial [Phytomonospora sp.]
MPENPGPVTPGDVLDAVASCSDALGGVLDADWSVPAGDLTWSCWDTAEHLADDLFAYAGQLGPRRPPLDTHVAFAWKRKTPGGPASSVFGDPAAGPAGLAQIIEACGTFLSAVVATVSPDTRAHHVHGVSDPEGFAAMGVVETLVHTHDLSLGLGFAWTPPPDLCARVLYRLFPDAPEGADPWATLLWATGRGELPGRPRLTDWRWFG